MSTLDVAIKIAKKAHKGQKRRDGKPYITHPTRVMKDVIKYNPDNADAAIVAILHDTLEDSELTSLDLSDEGFSYQVVQAVIALTKGQDEHYLDYVLKLKPNDLARLVKLADLRDHLKHKVSLSNSQRDKYEMAQYLLLLN